MTPPLTVLMSFHNDAPFIAAAVESVLNQTYRDFEFLLVNDASNDGSRDIVARYADSRIRLIDNPSNLRLARSLNRGLEAARGALVARLDANDVARPDRLEKQVRFLQQHPEIALVGGQYEVIDTHGRTLRRAARWRPVTELGVQWYFLFDSPFVHSAVMFRKAAVEETGRYDPGFTWAQDADLWARLAVHHRLTNLPDVVVSQRYDQASITYDSAKSRQPEFLSRLTGFFAANMRRSLAVDDVVEWAEPMTAVFFDGAPVGAEVVQRYLDAVEAMERRFVALHPEAASNTDVRRGKVQMLARALFRTTLRSRRASLRVFNRMLRADPGAALLYLPKYAAVGVLGSRAWNVWRWWRGRRQEQRA